MIPILFDSHESEFTSNGICRLIDCMSCLATEVKNGIYELVFTYPVTGRHYADIQEGCVIYALHDDTKKPQPFDIYKRSIPINGVVTFNAHHISYRLRNVILKPFTAGSCVEAMSKLQTQTYTGHPFTMWTDKEVNASMTVNVPISVKAMLGGTKGGILDTYGTGEYEFDGFDVKLHLHRGQETDVQIRGGKNLTNVRHEVDISSTYNAVAPYWTSIDSNQTVVLPEGIVTSDSTSGKLEPITSAGIVINNGNTSEPIEAFISEEIKAVPMNLSENWRDAPTPEQLRAEATRRLNASKSWEPDENIEVDFVALWQTEEYKSFAPLQRVRLCDKVSVIYPYYGINSVQKQVIRVEYDVLMERYTKIELGKAKVSLAKAVGDAAKLEILETVPTKSYLDIAIDNASKLISGGLGGHVIIATNADGQPNEILIMDTDDKETAVNVLRINNSGIGFSTTGYNGPFRSAWTIDGHFVADFIDTGNLNANLMRAGIITDKKGKNYWNLDTGDISIKFDPGEIGAVTSADLERVENNARNWSNEAEVNAKEYTDEQFEGALEDYATKTEVSGLIDASAAGLRTEFSESFAAKGDTVTQQVFYYYQSTSPTQLFGGSWSPVNPGWQDGYYLWEKKRSIKADGTYTESDPVCITGNTGKGEPGDAGADALILIAESDRETATAKETPLTVNFVAKVRQGESEDIDPLGIKYTYAWYHCGDDGVAHIAGKGKTHTTTIDSSFCEHEGAVWVGLADPAMFYLTSGNTDEPITSNDIPLEVA